MGGGGAPRGNARSVGAMGSCGLRAESPSAGLVYRGYDCWRSDLLGVWLAEHIESGDRHQVALCDSRGEPLGVSAPGLMTWREWTDLKASIDASDEEIEG